MFKVLRSRRTSIQVLVQVWRQEETVKQSQFFLTLPFVLVRPQWIGWGPPTRVITWPKFQIWFSCSLVRWGGEGAHRNSACEICFGIIILESRKEALWKFLLTINVEMLLFITFFFLPLYEVPWENDLFQIRTTRNLLQQLFVGNENQVTSLISFSSSGAWKLRDRVQPAVK